MENYIVLEHIGEGSFGKVNLSSLPSYNYKDKNIIWSVIQYLCTIEVSRSLKDDNDLKFYKRYAEMLSGRCKQINRNKK